MDSSLSMNPSADTPRWAEKNFKSVSFIITLSTDPWPLRQLSLQKIYRVAFNREKPYWNNSEYWNLFFFFFWSPFPMTEQEINHIPPNRTLRFSLLWPEFKHCTQRQSAIKLNFELVLQLNHAHLVLETLRHVNSTSVFWSLPTSPIDWGGSTGTAHGFFGKVEHQWNIWWLSHCWPPFHA